MMRAACETSQDREWPRKADYVAKDIATDLNPEYDFVFCTHPLEV